MDYNYWKSYFESNRNHFAHIDWNAGNRLTAREKKIITSSLQQFQRGENSEGKHLFAYAKTFPDPVYLECIKLFIKEEQDHAKVLGEYLDGHSIPRIKGHWVDTVFRRLRSLSGIENTIAVLLVAELISKIYYDALQKATGSALLATICRQILKDEDQHIAFQCHTLRLLYLNRSLAGKFLAKNGMLVLLMGTISVVWLYHGPVLSQGGYSFHRFRHAVMQQYFNFEAVIASGFGVQGYNRSIV